MLELKDYKEFLCKCETCQRMCRRTPCWPSPEDIQKLMKTEFIKSFRIIRIEGTKTSLGKRIGLNSFKNDVDILIPQVKCKDDNDLDPTYHTRNYVSMYHGECILLTANGLCKLHDKDLKPIGGRTAYHKDKNGEDIRNPLIIEWNKKKGREILEKFKRENL